MANIIELGIDVSSFNEQKKAKLNEFIALFDKLSEYDGKVYNPILGTGLTEFNASLSQTSKILDEINAKMTSLSSATSAEANSNKQASVSTAEYASEIKKLTETVTEQQKQIAALKLGLSETTKEIISNTNATNNSINAKSKDISADKEAQIVSKTNLSILRQIEKSKLNQNKQADLAIKQLEILKTKELNEAKKQQAIEERRLEDEKKKEIDASKQAEAQQQKDLTQKAKDSIATKNLTNDYRILQQTLKDQAANYSNLYINAGKNAPETKAALAEYATTASVVGDIDKKLQSAEPKAFGLGRGLSTIYNRLRIIAYVLPGIGIAGIFTLGFEAIQAAAEGLGMFDDNLNKVIKDEDRHNQVLNEQLSLLEDLKKAEKEYLDSIENKIGIKPGDNPNILSPENKENQDKAKGLDAVTLSTDRLSVARDKLAHSTYFLDKERKEATKYNTGHQDENDEELTTRLEKQKSAIFDDIAGKTLELNNLKKDADQLNTDITNGKYFKVSDNFPGESALKQHDRKVRLDLVNNEIKEKQSSLDLSKSDYKALEQNLTDFYDAKKEAANADFEHQKLLADEERKLQFNLSKDRLAIIEETQQKIIRLETSTEAQRISAITKIKEAQEQLNKADYINIRDNSSSTPNDIKVAYDKMLTDNKLAEMKANEEIAKLVEENRQARLKAVTALNKDLIEENAIGNQKIYQDDTQALSDRLTAYSKYIKQKQSLRDLDYALEIDVLSKIKDKNGALDPTAAAKIAALTQHKESEKANIQADTEKQVYDIVTTSLDKQLKAVIEENNTVEEENKKHYTQELNNLNESYNKKVLTYKEYRDKLKKLEKEYNVADLKEAVSNDKSSVFRLERQLENAQEVKDQADKEVDTATVGKGIADQFGIDKLGAEKNLDAAIGKQKAAADNIKKINEDLANARNKQTDDENKEAKAGISTKEKNDEKWYQYAIKIENELYKEIKEFGDKTYEYRLSMLEKTKAIVDEQYGYEINAIEKSSLTAKDKAALQIQLAEQKREYDKQAQLEEKTIKIQEAEFDKKLSIAHIILSTAEAIMAYNAKANPAGAFTAGIVGGIELAVAESTRIPSFKDGVTNFKGGVARYGEAGAEIVKMPSKAPRLITTETISYLPKGTDIIPVKDDAIVQDKPVNDGWDQTIWLAKQFKKVVKQPKVVNNNIIKINLGFENYKKQILGN